MTDRALRQAARSLLLAQSSDWAFILKSGTSVEYPEKRIRHHIARCNYLCACVEQQDYEARKLQALEYLDNIFPFLDYRVFAAG